MKRINLLMAAFLALIMVLPAAAQANLGIIGGLNFADLDGKNPDGTKIEFSGRTGLGIGGVLDLAISENASLVFQPMYLQKGAKQSEQGVDFTFKANYIEIPALVRIAFGAANTRPYIFAGPSLGIRLSADIEASMGGSSLSGDIKDLTSSTDFGLAFGGGLKFQLENLAIFVDGRYALGLSDIFKGGTSTTFEADDAEIKTRGIQIMGGVLFPLGK